MTSIFFLADADEEKNAAARYYEQQVPGLGHQFLDALEQAVLRIRQHPESGAILHDSMRRMLLARFPFGLLYRMDEKEILILAVMHLRRKPGYWKDRLRQQADDIRSLIEDGRKY